jgi:sterol desaturase/sphingolipid hydroxylase (fatty acid hydroxylase superfamily)
MRIPAWLQAILAFPPLRSIPRATAAVIVVSLVTAAGFALVERYVYGHRLERYKKRHVVNDWIYNVFFNGGYFTLLVYPIVKLTEALFAPWKLNLLPRMHVIPATIIFYVVADFSFYWAHRLMHTRYLWPFHSIHHSQSEMTYLTTARFHILDVVVFTVVTLIPAVLIGWPAGSIAAVSVFLFIQDKIQHAEIDWTYGPLYRIFVSPRFHRIHHGRASALFNRNYGRMLPLWDHVFGTAHATAERPVQVGVEGLVLAENHVAHFVYPFRTLRSLLNRGAAVAPQPPAATATVAAME